MQSWIKGLVAASVISAVCRRLTPEGPVKKVTAFTCGVMLLTVLFSPLIRLDRTAFSLAAADYRRTAEALTQDLEAQEKQLLRSYIEERTAAYILDEAKRLGIDDAEVTVLAKWGDDCWVPYEVSVKTAAGEEQRRRLTSALDAELGVSAERLHWDEG